MKKSILLCAAALTTTMLISSCKDKGVEIRQKLVDKFSNSAESFEITKDNSKETISFVLNSPDQHFYVMTAINDVMGYESNQIGNGDFLANRIVDHYEWNKGCVVIHDRVEYDSLNTKVQIIITKR